MQAIMPSGAKPWHADAASTMIHASAGRARLHAEDDLMTQDPLRQLRVEAALPGLHPGFHWFGYSRQLRNQD